jgi:hypothetical protein
VVYLAKRSKEIKEGKRDLSPACLYFPASSALSAVYLTKRSRENKREKKRFCSGVFVFLCVLCALCGLFS